MSDAAGPTLVEVENLSYRYHWRGEPALAGVSFAVGRGSVLGLVGPNGSGKTTLYRLVLGFLRPQAGRVALGGLEPGNYRRRFGIGYLPEQVRLPGRVRVRELARLMARLAGLRGHELNGAITQLLETLAIEEEADALLGTLSHGYRQRVGLLAALLGDPQLLLLDEPANGLDPASVGILRSVLRGLRRRGKTVVVSSHNLLELERVCDEVLILRQGRLLGQSSRAELARQPEIWVVQLSGGRAEPTAVVDAACRELDGVRLAADEVAFIDEGAAWACARRVTAGGGMVEDVERRRFDLEYLFHSLIQGGAEEGGA